MTLPTFVAVCILALTASVAVIILIALIISVWIDPLPPYE